MNVSDLSALEMRVLETLTEAKTTSGTVRLAADMWRSDNFTLGADPVGIIQMTLDSLSERGLVNFKVESVPKASYFEGDIWVRPNAYSGLAYDIRLTKRGWTLMGYPNRAYQVGTRDATDIRLDPKGDRTNFRKHGYHAEGIGDIETLTFVEHRAKYPHHVHNYGGEGDDDMARTYTKVTDAIEGTLLAYRSRFPTASYDEIAEATGIPVRTVKYALVELPRLRRMADGPDGPATQKERILDVLNGLDFRDAPNLAKTLGRGDSAHDVVHALHDLKKRGLVDFDERGNGAANQPTNIRLSARGKKAAGVKITDTDPNPQVGETQDEIAARKLQKERDFQNSEHGDGAMPGEGGPNASSLADAEERAKVDISERLVAYAEPQPEYPLLAALIEREQQRQSADSKGFKYLEAADLIREADPETAALLEQKARDNDIPFPTPLESEYLLFFRNTPMKLSTRE